MKRDIIVGIPASSNFPIALHVFSASSCNVVVKEPKVSRMHANISVSPENPEVAQLILLSALNSVHINNERVGLNSDDSGREIKRTSPIVSRVI